MFALLIAWAALLASLVGLAIGRNREGGALTLSYFLGLSMIHVPGAFAFLSPVPIIAKWGLGDRYATELGFQTTVVGLAAFVIGAVLARAIDLPLAITGRSMPGRQVNAFQHIGRRALIVGIFVYFLIPPFAGLLPSVTPLFSALGTLLILGLWLMAYGAVLGSDQRRLWLTLTLLPLLPISTLVTGGFIGYGMYWLVSVVAFLFIIARRRVWFYIATPAAVYLGLSLFVTYMGERNGIRDVVWRQQAGVVERFERVSKIATDFEFFDFASPTHLGAIDGRLNQNAFVGRAMQRLASGWVEYAYGTTVPISALIPRAIWPDKPAVGGGGTLVSDFTGIIFDRYTSVGAGQVFEFYVNFGVAGVIGGFLLFGFVLMRLDSGIMRALNASDARGLLMRALPGLAMLQPGGNLVEMLVAVAGAIVVAYLMMHASLFLFPRGARAKGQPA